MEIYRTPDEHFENLPGYPFEPHYEDVDGLRLHYLDEGEGQPVVCFHGEPTWSYLYRKMIPPLTAAGLRVICPDFAGFGRSDKPTDQAFYTYDRHVELMKRLLERIDVRDAVAVVQDWGGPIGLRWAVENSERVAALAILNTGLFTGRVSEGFMNWRRFVESVAPDLPIGVIVQGATSTELPGEIVAAYEAPWPTVESKAGTIAFPMIVPLEEASPGASEMAGVLDALSRWQKPCLVAFSDGDPVFPFPRSGEVFTSTVPSATEQVRIEGASHFLQEDRGEQIAEEIVRFLGR